MAKNSRYCVKMRRRREGKTDYKARKALVLSKKPRLVTRSSLKNTIAQIVIAKPEGDKIVAVAHSRELKKNYGWKANTGNIPAAYLTGLLCGFKGKAEGIHHCILDIGLVSPSKGHRAFATLIGVVEAGININFDEGKIVKERIEGDHIAKYANELGVDSEGYRSKFSKYLEQGLPPETLPEHFRKAKSEIFKAFNGGSAD